MASERFFEYGTTESGETDMASQPTVAVPIPTLDYEGKLHPSGRRVYYAPFRSRTTAAMMDLVMLVIFTYVTLWIIAIVAVSLRIPMQSSVWYVLLLVNLQIAWLYFSLSESGLRQATLGKRFAGIVVTDLRGRRISFGRPTARFFAKFLSAVIPLGAGFLAAAITERKQALHDHLSGCLVIRKPPSLSKLIP